MLGYPEDVEDVFFKKDQLINYILPGTIIVDHTTSSP